MLPTPALNSSYRKARVSYTPSAVVNVEESMDLRHFLPFFRFFHGRWYKVPEYAPLLMLFVQLGACCPDARSAILFTPLL